MRTINKVDRIFIHIQLITLQIALDIQLTTLQTVLDISDDNNFLTIITEETFFKIYLFSTNN